MYVDYFESPIGMLKITSDDKDIYSLEEVVKSDKINGNALTERLKKQLIEYFDGDRETFDISVKLEGTEFQKKVWTSLMDVPYGSTVSYKDIAVEIGNPKSAIAVGNANNKNKLLLLVPCHRIVGSSGSLVGFRLGLDAKKYLLDLERK